MSKRPRAKRPKERLATEQKNRRWWKDPKWIIATIVPLLVLVIMGIPAWLDYCSPPMPQPINIPVHLAANTEYRSISIYLKQSQTLHLAFLVREGGPVTVGVEAETTSEFFGFSEDSTILKKDCRLPLMTGSATFRPRDNHLPTGLYYVIMTNYSQVTELDLQYWVGK